MPYQARFEGGGLQKMAGTRTRIQVGAICLALIVVGQIRPSLAVSSRDLDVLPDNIMAPTVGPIETERRSLPDVRRDPAAPAPSSKTPPAVSGNPLWSIPLSRLSATRDRPIFSASRRPLPQAVAGPVAEPVTPQAPVSLPEPLKLKLIGAVVGESDAIAVFVDRASNGIVRMRRGDTYAGWQLGSIVGREATLTNGDRTETVVMVRETSTATAVTMPVENVVAPSATMSGTSFAPFTPRSTPKNGEHDGL